MNEALIKKHNIKIIGKGEKVLFFVHGFGCNQDIWRYITPAFLDSHTIILLDLMGSGNSEKQYYYFEKYSNLQAHADDILAIINYLQLSNIVFIGHSVGASIGMLASLSAPTNFSKLILIAASPCYINENDYHGGLTNEAIEEFLETIDSNFPEWSAATASMILGTQDENKFTNEISDSIYHYSATIAKHFAKVTLTSDCRKLLPAITLPTLILQSEQDSFVPKPVSLYLHQAIKNSLLIHINCLDHCPQLTVPNDIINAIKGFIT